LIPLKDEHLIISAKILKGFDSCLISPSTSMLSHSHHQVVPERFIKNKMMNGRDWLQQQPISPSSLPVACQMHQQLPSPPALQRFVHSTNTPSTFPGA